MPGVERYVCLADKIFDGLTCHERSGVVVRGGSIEAVLPRARIPRHLPAISIPESTIIPGLIDCHVHFMRWQGPLYLTGGVTTIRDTGNELDWILARREEWGEQLWPRILCVGPMVDGPRSGWSISRCCVDEEGSLGAIAELAARGVDGIKLYAGFPSEWLPGAVSTIHRAGLTACMHCVSVDMVDAAAAGVDELFHLDGLMNRLWPGHPPGWLELWGDPHVSDAMNRQTDAADRIARLGPVITPTLSYYRFRQGVAEDVSGLPERARRWLLKVMPREMDGDKAGKWRNALPSVQRFLGLLAQRGVPILAGTDVPWVLPGSSMWTELRLLSESGLGPLGALRSATSQSSVHLRIPEVGMLEEGRCADLAFVRGDPTCGIPLEPEIPVVVRGGKAYETRTIRSEAVHEDHDPLLDPWGTELARRSGALEGHE
jgi:hypothetical protein